MKKKQEGFGAVEGLLIVIIVLIVGFIGYYVYNTSNDTNSTYDNAAKVSNNTVAKTELEFTHTADDEAQIVKAVKAKYPGAPDLQVVVREYKDQFAKGTAGGEYGGFAFIAKKENGAWSVIFAAQQEPSTADGQKYDLPTGWYSTDY
jgi:hypothetical protein